MHYDVVRKGTTPTKAVHRLFSPGLPPLPGRSEDSEGTQSGQNLHAYRYFWPPGNVCLVRTFCLAPVYTLVHRNSRFGPSWCLVHSSTPGVLIYRARPSTIQKHTEIRTPFPQGDTYEASTEIVSHNRNVGNVDHGRDIMTGKESGHRAVVTS